jgi:hypothetical protein
MQFELVLFSTNPDLIRSADENGVDAFIVDWEARGKEARQSGFDTQVNHDTLEDLKSVRRSTARTVLCRLNSFGDETAEEVRKAIEAGADELLLPMITSPEQPLRVLEMVDGACGVGILVETPEAVCCADRLAALPLSRVYVGLNDLAISRNLPNIFSAVSDGTVEQVRRYFKATPFGFGGLTLPERGFPIPARLLISEMARLNCQFSFMRRSFWRDTAGRDLAVEIPRLKEAIQAAFDRTDGECERCHQELLSVVERTCLRNGRAVL